MIIKNKTHGISNRYTHSDITCRKYSLDKIGELKSRLINGENPLRFLENIFLGSPIKWVDNAQQAERQLQRLNDETPKKGDAIV